MSQLREMLQFLVYWFLTYLFGWFCFFYCSTRYLFGLNKRNDEDAKRMQPSCLSDPIYGNHKYFKSQGVKIHYVDCGDEDADVVLLLHGTPGFWFCWRKQIPELSNYFRVIAMDLRGCGDSETPSNGGSYKKEILMQDIIHLLSSLGCTSTNVVCCETIGYLGWELCIKRPKLVKKLVCINAPHPSVLHHLFHVKPYYYFKYWYLLFLQIPCLPEAITSRDQTSGWLKSMLDPSIRAKTITDEEIEAYKYTYSRKDDWRGVINHLRQIDLRPYNDKLHKTVISTPTLFLIGSSHPYLTVESAYRSAELVERIKIRIIPNAGNNLQITHSKKVNEELIDYLFVPRSRGQKEEAKADPKPSLVGRVFGAVKPPYSIKTPDVASISSDLREAAQHTLINGVSFAQNVWPLSSRTNMDKMSQVTC